MTGKPAVTAPSSPDIARDQLATLQIRRVIFHDVPKRIKGQEQAPTLSEVECTIDAGKAALLKDKLVRVLASSAGYDLEWNPQAESSVPKLVALMVSHRLSPVREADLILVMEDGRLVETGTHDTLIDAGGKYAELCAIHDLLHSTDTGPPPKA